MTDPETRLAELWAEDEPPVRDSAFENKVSLRIERRRWLNVAIEIVVLLLAALAVGWAAWPFVAPSLDRIAPLVAVAAALGLAVWSANQTFERVLFGGYEDFTRDFASE